MEIEAPPPWHELLPYLTPDPGPPLDDFLGQRTLAAMRTATRARAAIIRQCRLYDPRPATLDAWPRLSRFRSLSRSQLELLRAVLLNRWSYWHGNPIYRRLPPTPGFAFRLAAPCDTLVVLIDLHNPGWSFQCGEERYGEVFEQFHFAGRPMRALAKSLFPEYASRHEGSVWRQGAIRTLEQEAGLAGRSRRRRRAR